MSTRGKRIALAGVAGLLLVIAGGAVALKIKHDNDVEAERQAQEEAEEAEQAALEAEEVARERALAREERQEKAERQMRSFLVDDLEKSVSKDAEGDVSEGLLDGPILDTVCDPDGGAIDTDARTQGFSCLAVTTQNAGGLAEGYRYTATVNFDDFSYKWRLGGGGGF